ncbi:MAG: YncE family protein [Prevotella sp.]
MKKILSFAVLAMCMFTFTACNDDDHASWSADNINSSNGVFIINSGNLSSGISGSVSYYDYNAGSTVLKAFENVNGRALGSTVNDAVVYGSKMYIIVTGENTIEVVNKNTMKSIKQIKTLDAMGSDKGDKPRHGCAKNGVVYITTFSGYVAAIDTTSLTVTRTYQAGSYPEGITVDESFLYVANSDYGNGQNPSISIIDIETGQYGLVKHELITNPIKLALIGESLYILDSGLYDASWNQIGAGVKVIKNGEVSNVIDATMMAVKGNILYTVNAPYSYPAVTPTYTAYNTQTGTKTTLSLKDSQSNDMTPFSPAEIGADPITGNIFIASYSKNPDTGKANYKENGYVNVYDATGKFLKSFTTGVGPNSIVFNTEAR